LTLIIYDLQVDKYTTNLKLLFEKVLSFYCSHKLVCNFCLQDLWTINSRNGPILILLVSFLLSLFYALYKTNKFVDVW